MDLERLMDFAAGDQDQLVELVGIYLKQTTEQIDNLVTALQAGDIVRVSRVAHSCAGASATCGMREIVPLLRQVELLANECNVIAINELLPRVAEEFTIIKRFFLNCPGTAAAA